MNPAATPKSTAVVFSVTELTGKIKQLLEVNFPFIWIYGEISNLSIPLSGHCYFTLKDDSAQINAVMFRSQHGRLKFKLENGMAVTGLGRLSVFEPRGTYQLLLEHIEPRGAGALQAAFAQLKKKLADEGLFDPNRKKPLPFFPRRIAVVCSPTGAVVHDILRIVERRFAGVHVQIVPVRVQGDGAEAQIAWAIDLINDHDRSDLIILARGGGSLEDLQAFNSETVARAIARSALPVISAIGHETDYTIADFVADLRAPTPSAAAELAVPVRSDLIRRCLDLARSLLRAAQNRHHAGMEKVSDLSRRLKSPRQIIDDARLKTDDLVQRLTLATQRRIVQQKELVQWRRSQLRHVPLVHDCHYFKEKIAHDKTLITAYKGYGYSFYLDYKGADDKKPFYVIYTTSLNTDPLESFKQALEARLKEELEFRKRDPEIRPLDKEFRIINSWNDVINKLYAGQVSVLINNDSVAGGAGCQTTGESSDKSVGGCESFNYSWFVTKADLAGHPDMKVLVWCFKIDTRNGDSTNITLTNNNTIYSELERIHDTMVRSIFK